MYNAKRVEEQKRKEVDYKKECNEELLDLICGAMESGVKLEISPSKEGIKIFEIKKKRIQ